MVSFKDLSISRKLMRMSMIVSASVLLFSCTAFIGYELVTFKSNTTEHLSTDAQIVGINVTPALLFRDKSAAAETLAALRATPNIISAAVYASDGSLFSKYVRGFGNAVSVLPEKLDSIASAQRIGNDDLVVLRQIVSDGKPIGVVYIQSDLKEINQRLQSYALIALGVLAASFGVAFAVSKLLERKISGPLLSLAETTRKIASNKDYSVRAAIDSKDETGMLGNAFNDMLRQIEAQNDTLQESEHNFRELANAMPQIVWTARADGEPDYFNQRWFDYTGITSGQTLTWGWTVVIHPDDLRGYVEAWTESVKSAAPFNTEYRMRRAVDGTYRWHLARALPVQDRRGAVMRWFGTLTDIDDQKKVVAEIRQINAELEQRVAERTEKLTAANRALANANEAKDRFLATMSHELRTPLNAIIGFTGTLLMKLPGPLNTDQEKQLRTVQTSARHLLSLINDLLDLAKIEAGKVELKLEPAVCQSVVEEVSAALRPQAEKKGLEFVIKVPPDDLVVQTDRRALSQIIINLTNNAIKFTEKGSVKLMLSEGMTNASKVVLIRVEDTGPGIRPEDQTKLFEAFSRVDGASRQRTEGTGLGLHLSRKLAELLGGTITFHSEYGKGSAFTLQLPGQ